MRSPDCVSSFSIQWGNGKVIVCAPSPIGHTIIAASLMEMQDVDHEVVEAILRQNYEFRIVDQAIQVENEDPGSTAPQRDPDSECETQFTKPDPGPGPGRILSPVAVTVDEDEDDHSASPVNQTTPTYTHTEQTCNTEGSQKQKVVDQDENTIEEAREVASCAPVSHTLGGPRKDPLSEPLILLETPMIGILSGKRGTASDSPSPHSFVYYRGSCQDHQACQIPGAQVFPPPSDRRRRSQKIIPITKRAYLKLE